MNNIPGFEVQTNNQSSRIIDIKIKNETIEKLIFPFKKFDLTAIEYKPFTRFTIAKSLDDLSQNKLSILLNEIIRDRKLGCFIIGPEKKNQNINDDFLVKLSTAVSHLIGNPNHDSMAGKYYARFHVKHTDSSDSVSYTHLTLPTNREV